MMGEKKDDGEVIHRSGMDTTVLPMEEIGENVILIEDFTKATGSLTLYLRLHRRHVFEREADE